MVIGSILHGAYGDYYEQALCLKHYRLTHPNDELKLFFASPHRRKELSVLDFSWASGTYDWQAAATEPVDRFFQFQLGDAELKEEVLDKLPVEVQAKIGTDKHLPWHYLRKFHPFSDKFQLALSPHGVERRQQIERELGLSDALFSRPTIGFLWRYRAPGGAIKNLWPSDPADYVAKYSRAFRRLIERFGCHVLICGMRVKRTAENEHRVDNKYPEYGLDLPDEHATHLTGQSWACEMEILARCDLTISNPSGFSEALYLRRGSDALVVDPPAHYVALLAKHRMPLFDFLSPAGMLWDMTIPHSEDRIVRVLSDRLQQKGYAARG